jgi:hypothetical protein
VNLGQTMLAIMAMGLLSFLILQSNAVMLDSTDSLTTSDIDAAATTIAQSIMEEASGKLFDDVIADSNVTSLTSTAQLSPSLGPESGERFRDTTGTQKTFNDFDDFNGLFLVYKSDNPADAAATPGADWEFIVPNIHGKFFVHTRVAYVLPDSPDVPVAAPTWHKMLTITISSPSSRDTLRYATLMSFWN